jgi:hypothetical protein
LKTLLVGVTAEEFNKKMANERKYREEFREIAQAVIAVILVNCH